jgi:hypothetical protein
MAARRKDSTQRSAVVDLIVDRRHYDEVVTRALSSARVSVWVATANVKDVRVEAPIGSVARARGRYVSLLEHFRDLTLRGVEIRFLHARRPSQAFRDTLRRLKLVKTPSFEMRECPRQFRDGNRHRRRRAARPSAAPFRPDLDRRRVRQLSIAQRLSEASR